jgi:hypothetical protein
LSHGNYTTGHNLKKQFQDLPDDVKQLAHEFYAAGTSKTVDEFTAELDDMSNAFVEFRYWNERERRAIPTHSILEQISAALHRTIRAKYPHLPVTFENRPVPDFTKFRYGRAENAS